MEEGRFDTLATAPLLLSYRTTGLARPPQRAFFQD